MIFRFSFPQSVEKLYICGWAMPYKMSSLATSVLVSTSMLAIQSKVCIFGLVLAFSSWYRVHSVFCVSVFLCYFQNTDIKTTGWVFGINIGSKTSLNLWVLVKGITLFCHVRLKNDAGILNVGKKKLSNTSRLLNSWGSCIKGFVVIIHWARRRSAVYFHKKRMSY